MQHVRRIIPRVHFTRLDQFHITKRTPSLTAGMDTTALPYVQMTATSPHSSPPWGCYRYKTAPQGYIPSGDGFSRWFDEIVSDIPNKTKCIDDTLLWARASFFQEVSWLDTCGRNGINYLVVVDCYSNWPVIVCCQDGATG